MISTNAFLLSAIWQVSSTVALPLDVVLSRHPTLTVFHDYLKQFDLLNSFVHLENITVLAPTNQAYYDLAQWGFNLSQVEPEVARSLLTYHILEGTWTSGSIASSNNPEAVHSKLLPPHFTNVTTGATVKLAFEHDNIITESGLGVIGGSEETDLIFNHGVVHSINSSLVLPHNITTTAVLAGTTDFLRYMTAGDAVEAVEGLQDATVLLPTDAAFRRIAPLLHLLSPQQLARIVRHHVFPGQVLYTQVLSHRFHDHATLDGGKVKVRIEQDGSIFFGSARVVRKDFNVYGGVAHVIDEVLLPDFGVLASFDRGPGSGSGNMDEQVVFPGLPYRP